MITAYMLSMDELIEKYPIGSEHLIDGEKYIVKEHIHPMASTNMASYPAIRFDKSNEIMTKELSTKQKEDLFNLAYRGCTDSDVRDYCAENNISYILAQNFMDETYKYLDNYNMI